MPFHFAEARANLLTNDVGDAVTGTAEYKVCAAEVHKVAVEAQMNGTATTSVKPVLFRGSYYAVGGPGPGEVDEVAMAGVPPAE